MDNNVIYSSILKDGLAATNKTRRKLKDLHRLRAAGLACHGFRQFTQFIGTSEDARELRRQQFTFEGWCIHIV